ncbi:MAG: asparagine synthase (glutamine-hydrolyzing) [Acidobacteriota bacterium]
MCGIAGWGGWGEAAAGESMGRMLGELRHRGPDAEGWCSGEGWALGARRLAVIDLATGGQPVADESGAVHAVLNGEIYNYRELRRELEQRGHRLRSQGDTEVLAHLWEEDGEAMLLRLRGMFALALVDTRRRLLFLARDRIGKKPLYWTRLGGGLLFASELKAIRAALPDRRQVSGDALDSFLGLGFVPEGQCIVEGVNKLPPAHWLSLDMATGDITLQRYWRLTFEPDEALTFAAAREELRDRLSEAVRLRLRADVPLAVFLSGGLDSGAVTALAAREQASLRALTVSFPGAPSELELARATARQAGVELTEMRVDPSKGLGLLPLLAEVFDEPLADSSALPTYLVAREARRAATVVLNGDGSDEALGGYRRFLAARLAALPGSRWWGGLASGLAGATLRAIGGDGSRLHRLSEALVGGGLPPYVALGPVKMNPGEVAALRGGAPAVPRPLAALLAEHTRLDGVNLMRALEIELFLPGDLLVKMDRATMACSLEARSPFLDHVLLERVATFPAQLLLRGFRTKALLRSATAGLLPAAVRRAPKRGFEVPLASWLAGPWSSEVRSVLNDPQARIRGVVDGNALTRWHAWRRHPDRQRAARAIYTLLTLEHWLRRWG